LPTDSLKCSALGLSLFVSEEALCKKMKNLKIRTPNIEKLVGSMIAAGSIDIDDGICNKADNKGHFTLHEFEGCKLWKKFKVIRATIT
jgi:hypothetical protein